MKHVSSPAGKRISLHKHFWRCVLTAGLFVSMLLAFWAFSTVSPASAALIAHFSAHRSIASSPSEGPVGAVISVTGSGMSQADGTQVQFGYSSDGSTCTAVADSQPGVIHNSAFSGWFRWPASTGTGFFQVCAAVSGSDNAFFVGNYQVLSATPPQVSIGSTTLNAGKPAMVTGANFLPGGTSVNLTWQTADGGQSLSLGTVSSDATGAFTQTFTVPVHASTGSYTVIASSGSGQPPTLSAVTVAFHVDGITLVAVPTPTAQPGPTASPVSSPMAAATAASGGSGTGHHITTTSNSSTAGKISMLLPIALIGLLLIVAALVAGVLVVRRQRNLALAVVSGNSASARPVGGAFVQGAGYEANTVSPPGNPGMNHVSGPYAGGAPGAGQTRAIIPFDPDLAEAMRQAQVSLFAIPRPPVREEVPS